MAEFLQFLIAGVTVGAIYGLVALGFTIIYNASHAINFAQGEFVMIGGMATVFIMAAGLPLLLAVPLAIVIAAAVGIALYKFAVAPVRAGGVVTMIIVTVGASIFLRGLASVVWDRNYHYMAPFSGSEPIPIFGATITSQSLWVLGVTAAVALGLLIFYRYTRTGKAMLATAYNPDAAQLMGINVSTILMISFGLAAALGALGGILVTPISSTSFGVGVALGLKGFAAAIVGGLSNSFAALAGGLFVGIAEAMAAGYLSSAYKDAVAFVIILLVLFVRPQGLAGVRRAERV